MTTHNILAFPNVSIKTKDGIEVWGDSGMTLRDYFAAKAMQGMRSAGWIGTSREIATLAYEDADAMLEARK